MYRRALLHRSIYITDKRGNNLIVVRVKRKYLYHNPHSVCSYRTQSLKQRYCHGSHKTSARTTSSRDKHRDAMPTKVPLPTQSQHISFASARARHEAAAAPRRPVCFQTEVTSGDAAVTLPPPDWAPDARLDQLDTPGAAPPRPHLRPVQGGGWRCRGGLTYLQAASGASMGPPGERHETSHKRVLQRD